LDQFTTLDGNCPAPQTLAVSGIEAESALISWSAGIDHSTTSYEIALDHAASLQPEATPQPVTGISYAGSALTPNTLYYAHIRTACDDGSYSTWDTVSFVTALPSSVQELDANQLEASISPNPATGFLNIHTDAPVNAVIYGIDGRQKMAGKQVNHVDIS